MSSFGSDAGGTDEVRVRLDWPRARPTTRSPFPGLGSDTDDAPPAGGGSADEPGYPIPTGEPARAADASLPEDAGGADLEVLRSEVATLRRSLHELSDQAQLRLLQTVLDEVAELRAEVREVTGPRPSSPTLGSLAPLVAEIAALREELSLEPVLVQLAEMRSELMQVRRRMRLRASGGNADEFPS